MQTNILPVEKGNDLSDPVKYLQKLRKWLTITSLKISPKENYKTDVGNNNESVLNSINKFKNPSIKTKKYRKKQEQTFSFNYVSY